MQHGLLFAIQGLYFKVRFSKSVIPLVLCEFSYLVQIEAEKQYRHKLVFQPCFSQEKEVVVSFALEIRRKNNMN